MVDVVLREVREFDIPRIIEACSDPQTQEWIGRMPSPYGEEEARSWLEENRRQTEEGERIVWAIADSDDRLIGCIQLFDIRAGTQAEVGYWAHPDARGHGAMAQACALAVRHGFDELDLDRIVAHTALENTASQRVLEANDFTRAEVVPDGSTVRSGRTDAWRYVRESPDGLHADGISVNQGRRVLLPHTTLTLRPGQVAVATGRPGSGHTALALALAGRLALHSGRVRLDGSRRVDELQKAVAMVDVPGVTEPDETVPLHTIIGEELAMAGRRAGHDDVRRLLDDAGLAEHRDSPMEEVPAGPRVRALARLAASRKGVRFVVLTYPERHGLPPHTWLELARELADDGRGVLVTASAAVDLPHDVLHFTIGTDEEAR